MQEVRAEEPRGGQRFELRDGVEVAKGELEVVHVRGRAGGW